MDSFLHLLPMPTDHESFSDVEEVCLAYDSGKQDPAISVCNVDTTKTNWQWMLSWYEIPSKKAGVLLTDKEIIEQYVVVHLGKRTWVGIPERLIYTLQEFLVK